MKKLWLALGANWQPLLLSVISVGILLFVGLYNLESITNGYMSHDEISALESATSGRRIIENPLFLPYKLAQYAVMSLGFASVYMFRAIVVLFGIFLVLLFYALARYWFSPRIAWLSTVMMATSSLFLHFSRLAVPDILLPLALLGLLASAWWLHGTKHIKTALFGSSIVVSAALYIPGIVWFVGLAIFAQRRHLRLLFNKTPVYLTLLYLLCILGLLSPLGFAFTQNPKLVLDWLALPQALDIATIARNFIFVPASLIVRALPDPVYNLGRLPYIDVLTVALAVLGFYMFTLRFNLVRTKTLIGAGIIAWILIALNNSVSIVLLLPLIYLTVASGILLLLHQWHTVFPRNPIARLIGLTLLSSVIGISIYFNVTRYFIAWSNSPITETSFEETPPHLL